MELAYQVGFQRVANKYRFKLWPNITKRHKSYFFYEQKEAAMMTIIYALQTHELYKKREQSHVLGFGQLTNESPTAVSCRAQTRYAPRGASNETVELERVENQRSRLSETTVRWSDHWPSPRGQEWRR